MGRDRALAAEQLRQLVRWHDRDCGRWLSEGCAAVLPGHWPSHIRDVDDVVRPIAESISQSQEEGEFVGGMATKPDDQPVRGCCDTVPECREFSLEFRCLIEGRPPCRPRRRI